MTQVSNASVHRVHADTVFVSQVKPTEGEAFVGSAVLPEAHSFYSAHTAAANRRLDPMVVIEACRQTGIHVAHEFYDVPATVQFMLLKASQRFSADAWRAVPASGPSELTMNMLTLGVGTVRGEVRSLAPVFVLGIGGIEIGRVELAASLATPEHYAKLRNRRRTTPPPMSDTLPDPSRAGAVAPELVGRVDPDDVLLADLRVDDDGAGARVVVPVRHLGLFDHPLDHVPGSLLLEAARQLATALSPRPAEAVMTSMDAAFSAFAELDAPVRLEVTDGPIAVVQAGTTVTTVAVTTSA